ncbi:hypothetical protein [Bdellovibrio sp. GT3]|uniref:hypothetical protein n=1 Tax=Bdellovibrio sp. GT3 TaxID=3136282 RepID=UPI0030F39822
MWILLKLIITVGAFLFRLGNRHIALQKMIGTTSQHEGIELFSYIAKGRAKQQLTTWNRSYSRDITFKLTKESKLDRWFKKWGFADEIQTRDLQFDELIYIASDNTGFMRKIQSDSECRGLITELFSHGCLWIAGSGGFIQARFPGDQRSDNTIAVLFAKLSKQIEQIEKQPRESDTFAWKALVSESLIWGFAGYAFASVLQWMRLREDVYVNSVELARSALIASTLAAVILVAIIGYIFRKSSRGHRIIVESILVLAFAIPFGGTALFSEINIKLDRSPSIIVEGIVEGHYTQMHRVRSGRHYITYHIQVSNTKSSLILPQDIRVSSQLYEKVNLYNRVRLDIGKGKLNHPWIREITAL